MKKKYFIYEYLVEGLILATAVTDYIPNLTFAFLMAFLLLLVYFRDGFQTTTIYYPFIGVALVMGRLQTVQYTDMIICISIVLMQYIDNNVYQLPRNNKLVGFATIDHQQYFQFHPLNQGLPIKPKEIKWNQGQALQKIINSKQAIGLSLAYYQLTMSYIDKMTLRVGEGTRKYSINGMAFCHGRNAAPLWYSSLFIHFASNGFKAGGSQHAGIKVLEHQEKGVLKKIREKEAQIMANQYYETITTLGCEKLVLIGHSFGCSALLEAYFNDRDGLQSKVTHIILLDPYLFPLKDKYLTFSIKCPVLVLANEYTLNLQDMHQRIQSFINKKNVQCVVWKQGTDLYQTDLCFFFHQNINPNEPVSWDARFQMNFEAINAFIQDKPVQQLFGMHNLGKEYKPEQFIPEHLFNF